MTNMSEERKTTPDTMESGSFKTQHKQTQGNKTKWKYNHQQQAVNRFMGRSSKMQGHVYDVNNKKVNDQFVQTMRALINWVGMTYKEFSTDLVEGVTDLSLTDPVEPSDPDRNNILELENWKIDIRVHHRKKQIYNDFHMGLYTLVLGQLHQGIERSN